MTFTLVMAACFLLWLAAYRHLLGDREFLNISLVTIVLFGVMLFASPTPPGYDPNLGAHRFGGGWMAYLGPRISVVLLAIASVSLLFACVGIERRSRSLPPER